MGLFDKLFPKKHEDVKANQYFRLLTGYAPVFTTWDGQLYESELVRSAIDARSRHISKLSVRIDGAAQPKLKTRLSKRPNDYQTWSQLLYRLNTLLDMKNTAFLLPAYDRFGNVVGVTTVYTEHWELLDVNGTPWIRFYFDHGRHTAEQLDRVGIMTKFQYRNDLFGESNKALTDTMKLINIQNQGIEEGVKSAATYRFMAKITNFSRPEDLAKERQRFTEENFAKDAKGGGLLLFPNTYADIKQIEAKPFVVDADHAKIIRESVYEYFGVNEDILTNKFNAETWSAFYEGAIEPFAVQFSQTMTKMLFTLREQSQGNLLMATANRLQYMSNADKLNVSAQMADRGLMTRNEIRQIWNLPPLPEPYGSQLPARGEYYSINDENKPVDGQGEGGEDEPQND